MQKFFKNSIGTKLELTIREEKNLSHIFDEIDIFLVNFEKKFSRFIPNNWLFDLNKNKTAILDENAYKMLSMMQKIALETDGYFDPTIGKRLTELGYGNNDINFENKNFSHQKFDDIIEFDQEKIFLKNSVEIEFGGIGKGFLIDWIFDFLTEKLGEKSEFLINFGGDMASRGEWKIAIESPFVSDEAIGILTLKNSFVACSSPTQRRFGQNSHHLINPFTGNSSTEIVTTCIEASIFTQNAGMMTDGYATALSVMDFNLAQKKFLQNPYINGVLIRKNGQFFQTPHSKIELFK